MSCIRHRLICVCVVVPLRCEARGNFSTCTSNFLKEKFPESEEIIDKKGNPTGDVDVECYELSTLLEMISAGKIMDSKTICAIQAYALRK